MAKPIHFIPTQWTLVINSADNDTQVRKEALGELYNRYRPPLIGYIERHWPSLRPDAHDLFHDFMLKMIDRNYLGQASRDKGKFRSFLLTLVSRFLHDEWKRRQAERRRPDFDHEPLENLSTPASEPRVEDENFDYEWAIHVIKMVQLQLRDHYQGCDKIKTFDLLRPYLTTEAKADDLEQAATVQGTSSSALRSELHRLRDRHRRYLYATVGETLGPDDDIKEEIQYLFRALATRLQGEDLEASS